MISKNERIMNDMNDRITKLTKMAKEKMKAGNKSGSLWTLKMRKIYLRERDKCKILLNLAMSIYSPLEISK